MFWQSNPFAYVMIVAGVVSVVVAFLAWRRRPAPGSTQLVFLQIAGALWTWGWAGELLSPTLGQAVVFHKIGFFGIELIGPALFLFAAEHSGHARWLRRRTVALLGVVPLISIVLVWTNPFGLFWRSFVVNNDGTYAYLTKTPGVWWWVDSAYTYALVACALLTLVAMFIREPGLYRRQTAAILAAISLPLAVDFAYMFGVSGAHHADMAPALFGWVGLVLYWGFTRLQLLDVTPAARDFIMEHLADPIVVTDTRDRLVYMNDSAERMLDLRLRSVVGMPVETVLTDSPGLLAAFEAESCATAAGGAAAAAAAGPHEWRHEGRFYHGRLSPLVDRRKQVRGRVLVLHDITARKVAEFALEDARRDLEARVAIRTAELAAEKDRLAGLNAVAVQMAHCLTTAEVRSVGLALAYEVLGCESAAMWMGDSGIRRRLATMPGMRPSVRRHLRSLLSTWKADEDGNESPRVEEVRVDPDGVRGLAIVPLVARRQTLGALCLVAGDPRHWGDPERLSLATNIASQISLALYNAKRYDDAQFLAERDALTHLLNHRGLSRRVEEQVARAAHSDAVFSLVMMDVDNFKLFNDTHGHVLGDKVLQQTARSLTSSLRRSDSAARCGGDEFVAILPSCDASAALRLLERVRASLQRRSRQLDGQNIPIKLSCGIATFPRDGATASELMAVADANLYRSKRRGGDCVTYGGADEGEQGPIGSFTVLDGLVTTVDNKDHYTRRHSEDVTEYAVALAAKLGLSHDTQRALRIAGLLHDVGKVGVPDHILRKPAVLDNDERSAVRQHVTLGELIIKGIPNQQEVVAAISSHHERYDGKGYPRGLKGEGIPLLGRILAVSDAYSAMITDRPYRQAMSPGEAAAELKQVAGSQLDPELVRTFLGMLQESEAELVGLGTYSL